MNASKFGLILLAVAALATPACFTTDDGDDDDDGGEGGESGEGSGGSSGGSSGKGGSSGSGGSDSPAGSGGDSGSSSCNLDGYSVTPVDCPSGSSSLLDDPVCNYYFSCLIASYCIAQDGACASCAASQEGQVAAKVMCYQGDTTGFADICITTSQGEESAAASPECILSE